MSTNTTITMQIIASAATRSDASLLDVKRVVLGLPVGSDRQKILDALVAAGADAHFLAKLHRAPRRDVPGAGGRLGPAGEPVSNQS
jgi:hypothetical protein